MDLLASLAALVGETVSDKTDSQNTLPAFLGKSDRGREELVFEGYYNYAFRQGDWVMIPPYPRHNLEYQLYNVKEDVGQTHNLAQKRPDILRSMMMRFEELKRTTGKMTNF